MVKKSIEDDLVEITVKETEKVYNDLIECYNAVKKDNPDINDLEFFMRWSCEHIAKINIALHMQREFITQLTGKIEGYNINSIPKSMIN